MTSRATRSFLLALRDALGVFDRLVDVAVDQQRQERAVEQVAVPRITVERGAIIGGGGGRVALLPGMAGGEITARRGQPDQVLLARLSGKLDRRCRQKGGQRGAGDAPGEYSMKSLAMLQKRAVAAGHAHRRCLI